MKKSSKTRSARIYPKKGGPSSSAAGVRWNLGDLYKSIDDPRLEADYKKAKKAAEIFEKKYKGAFSRKPLIKASHLVKMLQDLEEIIVTRDKGSIFASLLFAGDTQKPEYGKLMQKMQDRSTEVQKHLIFWELEWCALDEKNATKLINDKACTKFRHLLSAARRYKPHLLSEPEEKVINELENTGSRAFSRLFDETIGGMKFPVKVNGQIQSMSEQEALSMLYRPDRAVRKAAAEGLTEGFQGNLKPLAFIFNTLVRHHSTIDRLRSYKDPMASRNLANEIDGKSVDALLKACHANTGLVSRYYKLKAKLLGLRQLLDYDRYAPISSDMPAYSWKESKETVIEAYRAFSPKMAEIGEMFFRKNWIDAELRPGKRGGAFSAGTTPDCHPYILTNHTDVLRDAMTLAHELGHGIHQYLSQKQGYLQSDTPLTIAETASVFGEMLTFQNLLGKQTDPMIKLNLLCGKIEDAFATAFRQACMTGFERKVHEAGRSEGELPVETISKFWMEANKSMFGNSVKLTDGYKIWWCYIPHFIHTPFYCYAYSFGLLLVLSLYSRYRKEGKSFVPKYLQLLESGGSESPEVLTSRMGLDMTRPSFWNEGMAILDEMITEAEKLASTVKKPKKNK